MATIDEDPPSPTVRRPDLIDILWTILCRLFLVGVGLLVLLLFFMVVVEFGMAGWTIGGWIGLIVWIPMGIAAIVGALAAIGVGLWLAGWLIVYVFSLDQVPEAKEARREFDDLPGRRIPDFWPPAPYRAVAIIVLTVVLWAIHAPPILRGTKSWHDFWALTAILVAWPLGFLCLVARQWMAALGEWMRRYPAGQAFLGPRGSPLPPDDPHPTSATLGPGAGDLG